MVDIDGFKSVNDGRGHAVGDAVLCLVSERLRCELRLSDVVGRWGGDEFLVILEDTPAAGATDVAEQVRRAIADEPIVVAGGGHVAVTISIGRAVGTQDGEDIVRRADAALYRAKAGGRNCVATDDVDTAVAAV